MSYVDGFVLAVPVANKEAYRELAEKMVPLFLEHGASRVMECWGDEVPRGKVNDFYGAVHARADEVVVFSWVEYPSREIRDAGTARMVEDPRMKDITGNMPFDGMRMIFGGFTSIVDARKKT